MTIFQGFLKQKKFFYGPFVATNSIKALKAYLLLFITLCYFLVLSCAHLFMTVIQTQRNLINELWVRFTQCCCVMQKSLVDIQRWVSLVLVSLRVILTQSKEEVVLGRLQQLGLTICFTDAVGMEGTATDCTHQPPATNGTESTNPDMMFAKYVSALSSRQ